MAKPYLSGYLTYLNGFFCCEGERQKCCLSAAEKLAADQALLLQVNKSNGNCSLHLSGRDCCNVC